MHAIRTTIDADTERLTPTRRFDPRRHRRITGLFDLWLQPGARGGLVLPSRPDRPLDARAIADLVQRSGEAGNDVRILTSDGERHSELLSEVAGLLAHDVLVSPDGAEVRHRDRIGGNGPLHAVPVDRATRRVRDWIVIQPPELATPLPGWFTVDHGLVRPRKGVVGLPLRGGMVLATRADFVARRATAHRLATASDGLVTVAVTARAGGFLVGDYGGTQRVYSGGELAALLGDLPLYGSDLRLWLTWPSDPDEQHRLAEQARELAETTGATVWTPPPGGSAELIDGRQNLRALDHAGNVARWQAHRPRWAAGAPTLRATPDGLLVPVSARELVIVRTVPPPQADPPRADGSSEADGPGGREVPAGGVPARPAPASTPVPADSGTPTAETPAEPQRPAARTREEPTPATGEETAEPAPPTAETPTEPQPATEKTPSEPQPPAEETPTRPQSSAEETPAAPQAATPQPPAEKAPAAKEAAAEPAPAAEETPQEPRSPAAETPAAPVTKDTTADPAPATKETAAAPAPTAAAVSLAAGDVPTTPLPRPALVPDDRRAETYGPAWLPPGQQVNAEQFEAFVVSPSDTRWAARGMPTAELFLLAFLDPRSVPEGSRLLRVRVGPGGAIPMTALRAHVPARLQHLRGLREVYLLPAGRLDRTVPVDVFERDHTGQLLPAGRCDGEPLRIHCSSPARSIAGLPHDVCRWPRSGTRRAYALLSAEHVRLPRNWLRLYRRQPPVRPNRLLLELQVPRDRAIDVLSTADVLAPLTHVRTRAEQLRAAQVELILGSRSYGRVRVRRAYRAEGDAWRRIRGLHKGLLSTVVPQLHLVEPS